MGLLDQVIGAALGSRTGGGGRSSPLMMALMALLASRAMGGSQGGGLGGMLGGSQGGGGGGGGMLGGGQGGGLGGMLGGALGGALGGGSNAGMGSAGVGTGGMGGLGGLIDRLTRSGHGDVAQSWVGHGENRPIAPDQLADALGPDAVDDLSRQTGMPQPDLLSQLSELLPGVVDKLTPQGRLPDQNEMSRW